MLRDELRGLEIAVWLDSLEHIRAGVIQLETDLQSATVQRDGAKAARRPPMPTQRTAPGRCRSTT